MPNPIANIHANALILNGKGLLFLGDSGCGKSDLSFRLCKNHGATLIGDDRIVLTQDSDENLYLCPAPALAGKLEVRGIGIINMPYQARFALHLICRLQAHYDRFPEQTTHNFYGTDYPYYELNAFEHSTPNKLNYLTGIIG